MQLEHAKIQFENEKTLADLKTQLSEKSDPKQDETTGMLAHFRLADSRPTKPWAGGRDVKTWLRDFKVLVEDLPGISPHMVWFELKQRTTGLANQLLKKLDRLDPTEALRLAKEAYLETWDSHERLKNEALGEVFAGAQLKANDYTGLVTFISKMEEQHDLALKYFFRR